MRRSIVLLLATALSAPHVGAQNLSFVTCPIVRDTKAAPCWLAEYKGETYYLGGKAAWRRISILRSSIMRCW
jgi:hypothetical protein